MNNFYNEVYYVLGLASGIAMVLLILGFGGML